MNTLYRVDNQRLALTGLVVMLPNKTMWAEVRGLDDTLLLSELVSSVGDGIKKISSWIN